MFEFSSYSTKFTKDANQSFWHEGDWEMFQVAIKMDTENKTAKPFSATASQHYYGQTLKWNAEEGDNPPTDRDQDYVDKNEDGRPKIYVAKKSHATYFRTDLIDGNLSGCPGPIQYNEVTTLTTAVDVTGGNAKPNYSNSKYKLINLEAPVFDWEGRWGESGTSIVGFGLYWDYPPVHYQAPRGPGYRETHSNPNILIIEKPILFNDSYVKPGQDIFISSGKESACD